MSNYFDSLTQEERDEIRNRKPKTFYETVLDDVYKNIDYLEFGICTASQKFKKFYENDYRRLIIFEHAQLFSNYNKNNTFFVNDRVYNDSLCLLFKNCGSDKNFKNIRIEFLKFCIENNLDIS